MLAQVIYFLRGQNIDLDQTQINSEDNGRQTRTGQTISTRSHNTKSKSYNQASDSERERAKKEREELGDCLRKASKEVANDEEGRNCNSPCTISKIAGNDLIGMSQQQEEEVTQSQFESKDNVNGIEETTDTTPVSAVEGLFFQAHDE